MIRLTFQTARRTQLLPVTRAVSEAIAALPPWTGLLHIHSPHTTAAVTINEQADPDVASDMEHALDSLVPWNDHYDHAEGNSAAHIKTTLVGPSLSVPVETAVSSSAAGKASTSASSTARGPAGSCG